MRHTCYSSGYQPVGRGRPWGAALLQGAHNVEGTSWFFSQRMVGPLLQYIRWGGHILGAEQPGCQIFDCAAEYLSVLSMDPASCHPCRAYNFEVAPTFWKTSGLLIIIMMMNKMWIQGHMSLLLRILWTKGTSETRRNGEEVCWKPRSTAPVLLDEEKRKRRKRRKWTVQLLICGNPQNFVGCNLVFHLKWTINH